MIYLMHVCFHCLIAMDPESIERHKFVLHLVQMYWAGEIKQTANCTSVF